METLKRWQSLSGEAWRPQDGTSMKSAPRWAFEGLGPRRVDSLPAREPRFCYAAVLEDVFTPKPDDKCAATFFLGII